MDGIEPHNYLHWFRYYYSRIIGRLEDSVNCLRKSLLSRILFDRNGYNFHERCGFEPETSDNSQESPIALQYLDCVHQLWVQHPFEFEFSLELLLFISYHLNTAAFGNIILRNEKERLDRKCRSHTISIWSFLLEYKEQMMNPLYSPRRRHLHAKYKEKELRYWRENYSIVDEFLKKDANIQKQDILLEETLLAEVIRLKEEVRELKNCLAETFIVPEKHPNKLQHQITIDEEVSDDEMNEKTEKIPSRGSSNESDKERNKGSFNDV